MCKKLITSHPNPIERLKVIQQNTRPKQDSTVKIYNTGMSLKIPQSDEKSQGDDIETIFFQPSLVPTVFSLHVLVRTQGNPWQTSSLSQKVPLFFPRYQQYAIIMKNHSDSLGLSTTKYMAILCYSNSVHFCLLPVFIIVHYQQKSTLAMTKSGCFVYDCNLVLQGTCAKAGQEHEECHVLPSCGPESPLSLCHLLNTLKPRLNCKIWPVVV